MGWIFFQDLPHTILLKQGNGQQSSKRNWPYILKVDLQLNEASFLNKELLIIKDFGLDRVSINMSYGGLHQTVD